MVRREQAVLRPGTLGSVQYGTVLKGNGINLRTEPSTAGGNATVKGSVSVGDKVQFRTKLYKNGVDQYAWTYLEVRQTWVSNLAQIQTNVTSGTPTKMISDVPFVSQLNTDANLRNNDCFLADAVAWAKLRLKRKGYGAMPILTVDNVVPFSAIAKSDRPMTTDEAKLMLNLLGVPFAESTTLTLDAIRAEIDHDRPPILLGNYAYIKPGSKGFGHYFMVVGYGDGWFWINDPYLQRERFPMTDLALEQCITDVSGFAWQKYHGSREGHSPLRLRAEFCVERASVLRPVDG